MILLISIWMPESLKSIEWRLWEYRQLYKSHRRYYRNQQKAYEATKLTVGTFVLCGGWIA